jgi:hypothetical protein
MVQVSARSRFIQKHPDELLFLRQMGENAFDRDDFLEPLEPGALRPIDLRHAACGDALYDAVALLLVRHPVARGRPNSLGQGRLWVVERDGQALGGAPRGLRL